jgi:tungstate transport system substrate-binding protein
MEGFVGFVHVPTATMVLALGLLAMMLPPVAHAADAEQARPVVRIAVVNTPYRSGLLAALLPAFEQASGYRVEVYGGNDVFSRAEMGGADLVISHYGKSPVEEFVTSGKGLWPRPVFSNQLVLVGPRADPAKIRGMSDPFAAIRKIAGSGSPFLVTGNPGARYLSQVLMAGADNPQRGAWYIETDQARGRAMQLADEKGAYTLWGSYPFEEFRRKHGPDLDVMVWNTPVFHRVMVAIVVNPGKVTGVNAEGAKALQAYLLSPPAQAAVATFREEGLDRQTWWPAGRDNDPARMLGMTGEDMDD